jgi:sec-independent protein translocase protein TatA
MGISPWQLLIVLVIVLLLFGTKKLRGAGGDLGSAIKNFKRAMSSEPDAEPVQKLGDGGSVIEGEATKDKDKA